eukprot:Seg5765.1 transcript_id=Seg5765.1/GoldUCD/mRNA.D3Y31 product="Follistatin-related protein 3" protein_id=Seg5765.1/GoldUCD/D3Y31
MESILAVVVLVLACVQVSEGAVCRNIVPTSHCELLATKFKACTRSPVRMRVYCPETCGYCAPNPQKLNCQTTKCPPAKICVMVNEKPTCKCLIVCKRRFGTGKVCGQNGKVYPDLCDMINEECRTGEYVMVDKYGACQKPEKCEDGERETKAGLCKAWQESNACFEHVDVMKTHCPKTCGFCRQPTEPKCKRSKYGCCWNAKGDVAAKGPHGEGCGPCSDKRFCRFFKKDCGGNRPQNTRLMKEMCPSTCHYCRSSGIFG